MSRPAGEVEIRELPRPADVNSALAEAARRLKVVGGDRALIGGVALSIYGIERYTKDVDLAVTVDQSGRAETLLADADPKPLTIGGISILTSTGVRVDLIDHRFAYRALFEEAITEAKAHGPQVRAGETVVRVTPLEYLVAMKLAADRPKDELDLEGLLANEDLRYSTCRTIVERHLGLYAARRLDRIARKVARTDVPQDYTEGIGRKS